MPEPAGAAALITPKTATSEDATILSAPQAAVGLHSAMLERAGLLLGLGHRRLAHLAGPRQAWSDQERRRAVASTWRFGAEMTSVAAGSIPNDVGRAVDGAMAGGAAALLAFAALAPARPCSPGQAPFCAWKKPSFFGEYDTRRFRPCCHRRE